jgi:hypothetical protein
LADGLNDVGVGLIARRRVRLGFFVLGQVQLLLAHLAKHPV